MAFPNAPTPLSYGAPNVTFEGLDQIGEKYFKGAEERRKYDLARTFKDGLPMGPDGQPDFRAITEALAKGGDTSQLGALSSLGIKRDFLNEAQRQEAGAMNPSAAPPGGHPEVPSEPRMVGVPPRPIVAPTPSAAASGGDQPRSQQGESLRTLAAGLAGNNDATAVISQFARDNRIHPDAPLTPEQEAKLKPAIAQAIAAQQPQQGGMVPPAGPQGPQMAQAGGVQPQPMPQSGGPQSAAPQIGAVIDPSLGGLVPKPFVQKFGPDAAGKWIDYAFKQSRLYALAGEKEAATGWEKRAQDVAVALQKASEPTPDLKNAVASGMRSPLDYLGAQERQKVEAGNQSLTTEQKNARASGPMTPLDYERTQAQQKDDVTRYGKQLQAIQGSAQAANRQLQHIQLAEGLYNDPNFWSGSLEGINLGYKKLMNVIDPNNKDALPQEAFRKTMAAAVLNQVEQLKDDTAAVGGGGRIFQAQIDLMEKAANNPDNTVAANRLLTEIAKRAALESKKIAQMANKYKGGHLDADFAQSVDDHYTKNPMFTPAEMADVRLIAPPTFQNAKQAAAAKLAPGTPIKIGGEWYKSP